MTKLLPLPLIALAASAAAAPVPDEGKAPVMFFPTAVGTKWVYQHGDETITREVTGATAKGRAVVITVRVLWGKQNVWSEQMAVSDEGVSWVGTDDVLLDHPLELVRTKARPGERWGGQNDAIPQFRTTLTARGEEVVEVPAGRFRALKVEAVVVGRPEPRIPRTTVAYYTLGLGLVKEDVKTEDGTWVSDRSLKSFTPGKGRV